MRELKTLVAPKPPQGVLVRGHAGFVINKLSLSEQISRVFPKERKETTDTTFACPMIPWPLIACVVGATHRPALSPDSSGYRGTSLIRNNPSTGPYSRLVLRPAGAAGKHGSSIPQRLIPRTMRRFYGGSFRTHPTITPHPKRPSAVRTAKK